MMTRGLTVAGLAYVSFFATVAQARAPVQRDVEGYATASCLAAQPQAYLKDQGDAWASAIVQRSRGGLTEFSSVADAVKLEMTGGHVAVIRVDNDPGHDKEVPLPYCAEIVDAPRVAAAIQKAVKKLKPMYRQQRK